MRSLIITFSVFLSLGIQAQRVQRTIPYPCDSLQGIPKTTPEIIANPNKKVFLFTIPESVLSSKSDTVCFLNEALVIKKGTTFIEMRTADRTGFNRFVKTSKGIVLFRYSPPKYIPRA